MTTPVIEYLTLTYSNCCKHGGHSWSVINKAMQLALKTAIVGRFQFDPSDLQALAGTNGARRCLGFYQWIGKDTAHGYGESYYKLAIDSNNRSACIAFETWQQRKPFILDGDRLGVGSTFYYLKWWKVNSFSKDGTKINISSEKNERKSLTVKELREFVSSKASDVAISIGEVE
jgi:hypothetical protein